jgi:hypothetical protein
MEYNKKKPSGIPFTLEKLRETADVLKRLKKMNKFSNEFYSYLSLFFFYLRLNCLQLIRLRINLI